MVEYSCGTDNGWSEVFKFKAISNAKNFSPRFAIYGDLGYENGVSVTQLKADVKNGLYDVILHVGDIAYNLNKVSSLYIVSILFNYIFNIKYKTDLKH